MVKVGARHAVPASPLPLTLPIWPAESDSISMKPPSGGIPRQRRVVARSFTAGFTVPTHLQPVSTGLTQPASAPARHKNNQTDPPFRPPRQGS